MSDCYWQEYMKPRIAELQAWLGEHPQADPEEIGDQVSDIADDSDPDTYLIALELAKSEPTILFTRCDYHNEATAYAYLTEAIRQQAYEVLSARMQGWGYVSESGEWVKKEQ
jgi:hypothetical protein